MRPHSRIRQGVPEQIRLHVEPVEAPHVCGPGHCDAGSRALVGKLVLVPGAFAAAGSEQIGRVAVHKLVAGEAVGAQEGEGVAGVELEYPLAISARSARSTVSTAAGSRSMPILSAAHGFRRKIAPPPWGAEARPRSFSAIPAGIRHFPARGRGQAPSETAMLQGAYNFASTICSNAGL